MIDSFSCILFLRQFNFQVKLDYALFYQIYAEITTFFIMKCSVQQPSTTSCTRSSYTPSCKTEISRTSENHGKSFRVCKNIRIFNGCEVWIENFVTSSLFDEVPKKSFHCTPLGTCTKVLIYHHVGNFMLKSIDNVVSLGTCADIL